MSREKGKDGKGKEGRMNEKINIENIEKKGRNKLREE